LRLGDWSVTARRDAQDPNDRRFTDHLDTLRTGGEVIDFKPKAMQGP